MQSAEYQGEQHEGHLQPRPMAYGGAVENVRYKSYTHGGCILARCGRKQQPCQTERPKRKQEPGSKSRDGKQSIYVSVPVHTVKKKY